MANQNENNPSAEPCEPYTYISSYTQADYLVEHAARTLHVKPVNPLKQQGAWRYENFMEWLNRRMAKGDDTAPQHNGEIE